MKWYWILSIIIVVILIVVGGVEIWYHIEANKNSKQFKVFSNTIKDISSINPSDFNAVSLKKRQEIMDYTLKACKESYSKMNASMVRLDGLGEYLYFHKYDSNIDDLKLFNKQLCDCINSKAFNIIDLFGNYGNCKVKN